MLYLAYYDEDGCVQVIGFEKMSEFHKFKAAMSEDELVIFLVRGRNLL
jgi:hypothetical protein